MGKKVANMRVLFAATTKRDPNEHFSGLGVNLSWAQKTRDRQWNHDSWPAPLPPLRSMPRELRYTAICRHTHTLRSRQGEGPLVWGTAGLEGKEQKAVGGVGQV